MSGHPYQKIPGYGHWGRSIARLDYASVDPVTSFKFAISPQDKVATAGSCFAQHIARHLSAAGFNYFVAEEGHPILPPDVVRSCNYGVFSARYGNLYTSRQLVQLFDRAYGDFMPWEDVWRSESGAFLDPFRPTIQPAGFATEKEFRSDRDQHLAAVRHMFETLDYFVFTLGLTETWVSAVDGAAFPVCPGVSGGAFDKVLHLLKNLGAAEVRADMDGFLERLTRVNPSAKVILTVSPVPLMATAEDRHVLVSTTLSKSVLRVACDELQNAHENVAYFPSYEIITGAFNRGRYFGSDLRSVTEEGVGHVMRLFLKHVAQGASIAGQERNAAPAPDRSQEFLKEAERVVDVICDEEALQAFDR